MGTFEELEEFNQHIALINEKGEQKTYEELIKDCECFTAHIGERCLIFIVCSNSYASVVGYIGALRRHIVPVLINENIDDALFNKLKESYHPKFIFMPQAFSNKCGTTLYMWQDYELVQTNEVIDYQLNDTLALLLTTSGSTGSPKLVRQSYKNIDVNARSIIEYLGITSLDRAITTLPMHYTYGLSIINSHLLSGASIILNTHSLVEKAFWQLIKEQKATNMGGVPYIYEMLYKLHFDRMDLPSLKVMTQAGGKLSKELAMYFAQVCQEKQMKFFVMYGQTEATARMAYLPYDFAIKKAGSMGIAIPGGSFELLDEAHQVIPNAGVTGELVYKGDNVTLGYANDRFDLVKGDENQGVLYTGDMAQRDEDGFYYIVGRKKRFLKLYGSRVNLDELEGLLKEQDFECVCHGWDDQLVIYTVRADEQQIKAFVMAHTGIVPGSFCVKHIPFIPRNEAGKVLYSKLQEV